MAGYEVIASNNPDDLHAGVEVPLLTKGVNLDAGQGELVRGSVIGIVTADGKGMLVDKVATNGSEVAKYVLATDVDTTAGEVMAVCYQSGLFHRGALVFGGDSTADDHADELRAVGIYLRDEYQNSNE